MASSQAGADLKASRTNKRTEVKSCCRALDVLDFFARSDRPQRTINVSEALSIPNSSTDEILRTLTARGYLAYDPATKHYVPSYKLVAVARGIEQNYFGTGFISEMMADLRTETGATVFLTLQNDCWVETVAEVGVRGWERDNAHYPTELVCFHKDRWCLGNNFGAAMLAQQSNVEVIGVVTRAQKHGLGPLGPAFMKYLVDQVARTRALGFALCRRHDSIQVDSIALPLSLQTASAVRSYAVGIVSDTLFENDRDIKKMATAMRAVVTRYQSHMRYGSQH